MATEKTQAESAPSADAPNRETLAQAVVNISKGFDSLKRTGLNRRAIVILLRDSTGVSFSDINYVLNGLENLAKDYTAK